MGKTFYITTLGCPKNQADSRTMERSLIAAGFQEAQSPDEATYHFINTCSFILPAREETVGVTLEAAELKKGHPDQKLILAGCFTERYRGELETEIPEVDWSIGTGRYDEVGSLLIERYGLPESSDEIAAPPSRKPHAPVKISDGCNRTCTFCAIPQFRGPFRVERLDAILAEVDRLAREGVREIDLVSQDTISYGVDPLLDLIHRIGEIEGIEWVRLLYLFPDHKTEALLRKISASPPEKLVPYFEIPIQHVSKRVLKAMRRGGDFESFRDLFSLARTVLPDTEVRTSFLTGFPGEKGEDLDELVEFIHTVKPEKLSIFPFSAEEGTAAGEMENLMSDREIMDRVNILRSEHLTLLKGLHLNRNGRTYRCMIDETGPDEILARRPQDAPEIDEVVHLPATEGVRVGEMREVTITGFYEYDMTGRWGV